jgi:hypothetical protein
MPSGDPAPELPLRADQRSQDAPHSPDVLA